MEDSRSSTMQSFAERVSASAWPMPSSFCCNWFNHDGLHRSGERVFVVVVRPVCVDVFLFKSCDERQTC